MARYPGDFQKLAHLFPKQMFNSGKIRSMGGKPRPPTGSVMGVIGAVLLGGSVLLANSVLYNVEGGHRAVVYSRVSGVIDRVYNEGTHFVIPGIQTPVLFDVRAKPRNVSSLTGTNDLQMVNVSCRVLSRPDVNYLTTIYRILGQNYDERVLPSIVNEVLKAVVAQFNASQLLTHREIVSNMIRDSLKARAEKFHILLDDVSITHMSFSPEFTHAVESKQIAEQDAQRASIVVEKAMQEKQSMIVKAQGEARAAELIGEAIKKSKDYVELKRLDTAKEIAGILANSPNRLVLDSETLLLNTVTDSRTKN